MTIRGSAVQEDASSGIWELEKETDGVRLTIGRAKGKGEGNYLKFKLVPTDLPGEDIYGDSLQGLVPLNFAGTVDEGKPDHLAQQRSARHGWARAIIGAIEVYPSQHPGEEKCPNTKSGIAKFLTTMWVTRATTVSDIEQAFVTEWMDGIAEHDLMSGITRAGQDSTAARKLETMFLSPDADHNTVTVGDYTLMIEKGKSKFKFVVGKA